MPRIRAKTVIFWADLINYIAVPRSSRDITERYNIRCHSVFDNINRMIAFGLPVGIKKVRHQGYGNARFFLTTTPKDALSLFRDLTTPKAKDPKPTYDRSMRVRKAPWFVLTVECEKFYA